MEGSGSGRVVPPRRNKLWINATKTWGLGISSDKNMDFTNFTRSNPHVGISSDRGSQKKQMIQKWHPSWYQHVQPVGLGYPKKKTWLKASFWPWHCSFVLHWNPPCSEFVTFSLGIPIFSHGETRMLIIYPTTPPWYLKNIPRKWLVVCPPKKRPCITSNIGWISICMKSPWVFTAFSSQMSFQSRWFPS